MAASASSQRSRTSSFDQPELERPEGHVVEDRGAEELDVGVLEDEPHLAVEAKAVLAGGHCRHVPAEGANAAARWADHAVEQLQQGGLAAAVGAEQRHPLARPDLEVDAVEGDLTAGVRVADVPKDVERLARHDTGGAGAAGTTRRGRLGRPGGVTTGSRAAPVTAGSARRRRPRSRSPLRPPARASR